jgi:myo-inositol 2-dehydrogenase / D-chiro-inositol 1-dehydrogenase
MSKPIGIGFVGAGWMGSTLMRRLAEREDAVIRGLHQRNPAKAEEALTALGLPTTLYRTSYAEMLADPEVDAVFLCSPNNAHGPQSIQAMQAGKHVFCEKPCATTFADFQQQIQLSQELPGLITYVNYLMNFDTMEARLLEMVRAGDFGTITQIQVNYRHPINIAADKAWKLGAETMGDAIGMGIIHALSVMLNIMAAQGAKPVRVYATKCPIKTRPFEADAIFNLLITFSNGASGMCFGNVDQANGYDAYHHLHGTAGGFIFDSYLDRPQKVRVWSARSTGGKWIYPLDPAHCPAELAWPEDTTTPDSGNVVAHQTGACVEHFLDCVKTGQQSFLSFTQSAATAELGWAALISADTGSPVDLPLDHTLARGHFHPLA